MDAFSQAQDCEAQLAELLSELASVQQELLDVLAAKRERMAAADVAGMQALQPREQKLVERLEACHARRAALLEAAARSGWPAENMKKLAALVDPGGRGDLGKQVSEASARMRLLRHHCLANWVLAQRSLLHLSQILEIIATGGQIRPTYGKEDPNVSHGALVDQQV